MTKAYVGASFAPAFAADSGPAGEGQQAPRQFRRRCVYCSTPHATDGLGPIRAGDEVSDGTCPISLAVLMAQLDELEAVGA